MAGKHYQPSTRMHALCVAMKGMFKTRPAEEQMEAAALRLARVVFSKDGPAPVDRAHPGFMVAMLALSMWDRMVADRLHPTLAGRVRELRLGYVPSEPPPLMRHAWYLEVNRVDADVRLFGDTIAVGGFFVPASNLWALVGWRNDGGHQFYTMAKWPPVWGDANLGVDPDAEEISAVWRGGQWLASNNPDETAFGGSGTDWLTQALQFAINYGEMLDTERPPVRALEEREILPAQNGRAPARKATPSNAWIIRRVYLDESPPPAHPPLLPGQPVADANHTLVPVEVRPHVRLQRCGPGRKDVKEVQIKSYSSRRWVSNRPTLRIAGTKPNET